MKLPPYPEDLYEKDREYFLKKFGLCEKDFDDIMRLPIKLGKDYPSNIIIFKTFSYLIDAAKKFARS